MAEKVEAPTKKKFVKKTKQPVRLYAKGVILGYKRSKSNCYSNCTLLKIDGVRTKDDTQYYVGKKVAYVYKAKKEINHSKFRVMWGKIRRSHGNSGVVRAKFGKSIPPKAFGAACRVMLYPSSIWDVWQVSLPLSQWKNNARIVHQLIYLCNGKPDSW